VGIHCNCVGPYALTQVVTESGIPVAFELTAHEEYTLGRPYIQNIFISSYQNEKYLIKAFQDGDITRVHGLSPEKIATLQLPETAIKTSLLPRTFAVFFNPNKLQPLADKNIRKALELAINKKAIVDTVLYGYGKPLSGPYPFDANATSSEYNKEEARDLISKSKLIKNASSTLDITLVTANTDEMKKVAELIKADWEAVGVHTTISIYDVSDLNQSIIKDREFQALLFGAITETPSDLYAFWHSSQRSYPGLNVSNYVSKTLDENLEILRNSRDKDEQKDAYTSVLKEFEEETPGIFLYSPKLLYIVKDKVTTILPQYSYDNSSRFQSVQEWYRFTDTVWPKTYYKKAIEIIENIIH
jgi:peptide/nickel transport system substrate-binding protein